MISHYVVLLTTLHVYTEAQFPPMGFPQPMPMGMGMPGMGMPPMPMQMPIGAPPQMPTVVMPYHSRTVDKFRETRKRKRRKPRPKHSESSSSSSSSSDSSSGEIKMRSSKDKHKRSRQVLTPVISYVTKDGYVVYQKKIQKELAKDWLEMGKNSDADHEVKDNESEEKTSKKKSRKKHRSKSYVSFE